MDAALVEGLGLPRPDGVLLNDLHPASPFAEAGLRAGDVVLALGGAPTNTPQEMMFRLASLGIGARVTVDYLRDGQAAQAEVTLIAPPDSPDRQTTAITEDVALRGLTVARINPALMVEFDLPLAAEGVAVTAVADLAARAGIAAGDVILAINGEPVGNPADVAMLARMPVRVWAIDLVRQGQPVRLRFRL